MSDDLLERLGRGCNCGRCKLDLCCCAAMEEAKAEIEKLRGVVDALLQHEASTFFGPDAEKHKRASWRGVIRKARATLGETK